MGTGLVERGDWSYDVELAVLEILKADITPEQLLVAVQKGKKIKALWDYVKTCKVKAVRVVFDSFLASSEEDSEDMGEIHIVCDC